MKAICVGGPYHGLVADLPKEQDIYRPTGELRPRYQKLLQSNAAEEAYFAYSDLSNLEGHELVMAHLRARSAEKRSDLSKRTDGHMFTGSN